MTRPPKVLVATDLSHDAEEALRQGDEYVRALGGDLAVCHVIPSETWSHPLFPQMNVVETSRGSISRERAVELLSEKVRTVTGRETDSYRIFVEDGAPHAAIVRVAETWGADRIVVGSVGATGLARMLLGSVALGVARHAHCPVLVARSRPGASDIVVGTDFSDPALPAISAAADEGRRTGGRVTVVHCLEFPPAPVDPILPAISYAGTDLPRMRADAEALADARLAEVLSNCGVKGERRVLAGPPAAALARVAEELDARLVVVGTAGRSGLRRMLLGSVAEAVVKMAPCSVLVVRLHPETGS